jgi:hypothetical protein
MLQSAGGQIGDFVQEADRVAAGLAPGQLGSVNPAQSAEAFRKAVGYASQRSGTAMQSAKEVIPMSSALEEPGLSTFQQMWNTKTQLGTQAFAPTTARVGEKAGLMRAGQQAAARDIEGQMANAIGPDKVDALRASMAKYRLGKRLEGVVEDAATRDMAKSGPGLKDLQVAQTMGATGPLGLPVAMASKFIRGRADSAIAAGANAAAGWRQRRSASPGQPRAWVRPLQLESRSSTPTNRMASTPSFPIHRERSSSCFTRCSTSFI